MIKLTITEKGGETNALSFDQNEVVIGRVQGNDIVLAKGNISKRHTKIDSSGGRLTVSDLHSTNGTYVNGRKIAEPTPVKGGDKIFVGDFLIVVDPGAPGESSAARRMPGPPPPPPPPPPRASRRGGANKALTDDELGLGEDGGGSGERPPSTASGARPLGPPPPPPPPRPTMAMPSLADDGVDMGLDEPPPSLADVGAIGTDDSLGALAGGDDGPDDAGIGTDGGLDDVFGSRAVEDEDARDADAAPTTELPAKPSSGRSRSPLRGAEPGDDGDATLTPPPAAGLPAARQAKRQERDDRDQAAAPTVTLESLLADPTVTAIVIAPGVPVEVERGGKMEAVGEIGERYAVAEAVWQLASTATPPPPGDNPIVDVRLGDGTQITALFPPVTSAPVCAALRKAALPEISLGDLSGGGDVEKILSSAIASRRNLLLAGDAQAVTALAGALALAVPSERKVVSIGASVKARPGWTELAQVNDVGTLIRAALAFRPQHLVVLDGTGAALPELLLAVARGQDGVIASVAARSAAEALGRLRAFTVGAVGAAAFPMLVLTAIDLVVYAASTPQGVRVLEIAEPALEGAELIPTFVARRPEKNRATQTLDVAGVSIRLAAAIAVAGDGLPSHLLRQS